MNVDMYVKFILLSVPHLMCLTLLICRVNTIVIVERQFHSSLIILHLQISIGQINETLLN